MVYVTQVKRWTTIIASLIGVLAAAHAIPALTPADWSAEWQWIPTALLVIKAICAGMIVLINALPEESS